MRNNPTVKSAGCSSSGPGFNSQQPCGGAQPLRIQLAEDSLFYPQTAPGHSVHVVHRHIYMRAENPCTKSCSKNNLDGVGSVPEVSVTWFCGEPVLRQNIIGRWPRGKSSIAHWGTGSGEEGTAGTMVPSKCRPAPSLPCLTF